MAEFFYRDISQKPRNLTIRHGISLGQITEGGSEFAVGTTILADDDGGSLRLSA